MNKETTNWEDVYRVQTEAITKLTEENEQWQRRYTTLNVHAEQLQDKLDKVTKCIEDVLSWTNGSTLNMSVQKRCKQTLAELKGETNE